MKHFPIFTAVEGRRIVLAGGSEAALAKLRLLLKTEARISVFAPEPAPEILAWEEGLATVPLYQAYPNPFRAQTRIAYEVTGASAARVAVAVFDIQGRLVRELEGGMAAPGRHTASWDGRDAGGGRAPAGVYFLRTVIQGQGAETVRILYMP